MREAIILFVIGQCGTLVESRLFMKALLNTDDIEKALNVVSDMSCQKFRLLWNDKKRQEKLLQQYADNDIVILTSLDSAYPKQLSNMSEKPAVLFVKGNVQLLAKKTVSIICDDNVSLYAEQLMSDILIHVQGNSILTSATSYVSGCIYDSIRETKSACQQIVLAVTGIDVLQPVRYAFLLKRMMQKGLVISELPIGCHMHSSYLSRHRYLLAGLSSVVCVLESARHSYNLLTAYEALNQSKDVVVPPSNLYLSTSQGSNFLLAQGAAFLYEAEDIAYLLENSRL